MIPSKLQSANKYFVEKNFESACLLYEKCFPSKISELSKLISKQKSLAHIYRNYLLSLKQLGKLSKLRKILYEIKAYSPIGSFLWETHGLKLDKEGDETQPLLTIIVPIHNSGQYLDHCIQSIRAQVYDNFQLILVNDGSTDNSSSIIAKHAAVDTRITVITNEKGSGNPGTPRNQALAIATGDYIGFVDSDDWIDSDFYSQLMSLALNNSADIAFSGGFYNHLSNGQVNRRTYSTIGFDDPTSSRFKIHDSFMIWDKVFKRSLLNMFDIRLGETKAAVDVSFIFKAYYYAATVAYDDNLIGYNYRRESESSVTVAHRKNSNCEFEFQAFRAIREWSKQNEIASYYDSAIDIKLVSSLMYTLKMVDESHFENVFGRVKQAFSTVTPSVLKAYCIASKKWWQFKEFEFVLNHDAAEVSQFLKDKEKAALEKKKLSLISPRYNLEGSNPGIIFFPCWMVNNPYQKLLYQALNKEYDISVQGFDNKALCKDVIDAANGKFKFIHLHWLHNFFDIDDVSVLENTLSTLRYAKKEGFEIIYTAHNIVSHDSEYPTEEKICRAQILDLVDHALVHGDAAKELLEREFSFDNKKTHLVPHGTYGDFYGALPAKKQARNTFGIPNSATVFLFFGNIKGYKGIFNLLSSFRDIRKERSDVYLIIAGRILDSDLMPKLANVTSDDHIIFRPGFIQNHEVAQYFSCADLCVLPYEAVLTSGAAMLSLSLKCPILAPSIGVLPEIVSEDTGMLFNGFDEMKELLLEYRADEKESERWNFEEFLINYDWNNLVKNIPFLMENN